MDWYLGSQKLREILTLLCCITISSTRENQRSAQEVAASVGKLEEENAKLKTTLDKANMEATRLKKDKRALTDKVEDIARKRDER